MTNHLPPLNEALAAIDVTWPAETFQDLGPWRVRSTHGAGKRVSSISAQGPVTEADIAMAEDAHRALGHTPLFMIRPDQHELDAILEAKGYRIVDPVSLLAAPVSAFEHPDKVRAFAHWPPLAIVREIWTEGGINETRQAIMQRATCPKVAILGRAIGGVDRASGAAYVGVHGRVAMIHSVEVLPALRRQGSAHNIMREAARWAQDEGAEWLSLIVLRSNAAALALYASLNMQPVGQYHYRSA